MAARLCACDCGAAVTGDQRAQYATELCKQRARAKRRRVSRLTAIETGAVDLPKMYPTTKRVLKALLAVGGNGATTRELCQPDVGGIRLSARVFELRELGFRIDVKELRPGSYRYTLRESAMSERLFAPESEAA
jgi:hypothetical protein